MIPNVFITGFERSGTTLLRRLVSMWPGFEKDLIHEQRKLMTYKTAQEAENNYFDEFSSIKSGEKIPYYNNADFVIDYIERFREFWPDSIILHIMRLPDAVAESCKRTFNRPIQSTAFCYAENVIKMSNYLADEPNAFPIKYEKLISEPVKYIKLIYKQLGFVPGDDIIHKILNTKGDWVLDKKRMCGLRYSGNVGRIIH